MIRAEDATRTASGPSTREVCQVEWGDWSNKAKFWLRGRRLEPDVVTHALGIEPSKAARRGEPRTRNPRYRHRTGAWFLESDVLSPADDHLDDHLRWLLDQLEPRAQQLRDVVAEQELDVVSFWCVVSMEAPNVDFELPPETIGRVAALGATLRLDIYAPDDLEPYAVEIPEPGAGPEPADAD
jgi:hypothetical protein